VERGEGRVRAAARMAELASYGAWALEGELREVGGVGRLNPLPYLFCVRRRETSRYRQLVTTRS